MYKESNIRSIVKGISWRVIATTTTMLIVYIFFGNVELAIAAGILESVAKVILYWGHEKIWQRIRWGKKRVEPFVLWFTGLPLSGKTTIADLVYEKLKKEDILIERVDSKDIRELIPEIGYSKKERIIHLKRVAILIKRLQKNYISVIASFVSPYKEARDFIRKNSKNFVEIYVKADLNECIKRDYKGVYANKDIKNLTGRDEEYEIPQNPEIVLDTSKYSPKELADIVYKYVKKNFIK